MDNLVEIKRPIDAELEEFTRLFNETLSYPDGLLSHALSYIRQRCGKRMRPMLILLMAKAFGKVNSVTQNAAIGLELVHTASLVHDDVVDESTERRGQASVNAIYNNKVSILVGDYIISTALLKISKTRNHTIVDIIAEMGRTLANGELLQLTNIQNAEISEDVYYEVIRQKTACLFEACAAVGALSVEADEVCIEKAKKFGHDLGIAFQIRDDIFDYFDNNKIGKPTGNDMTEGKLTLPVIYALKSTNNSQMLSLAQKVKSHDVTKEEIAQLVEFTKQNGGIEYAEKRMNEYRDSAVAFVEEYVKKEEIKQALLLYLDYVTLREK